ncbi:dephospho-CoA kinase [Lentibacillus sp. Marseille-P4043]|uniref:dephospho-CoA kinase n=1 Tax=Lentibacillus sp. Marseille-P4043 TaxID=2040293 RepID=UPI000D0B0C2F|nr:dephospho-CoA kinase [Lentibacillus sp. Marseille-P4043]
MALIIGLTGSIASGKSTVSLMFDDHNIPVVDADKLSREVVNPGEKAYNQIVEMFGQDVLRDDKTIDREKLGSIIFADEGKRKLLNNIVHPAVREKMLQRRDGFVEAGATCVVLDIPLLFESKLTHYVDKTLVVYVDEHVQLERLMNRNHYSEEEARQRIESQIPVSKKAAMADAVIDNNGTKYQSYEQLEKFLSEWNAI